MEGDTFAGGAVKTIVISTHALTWRATKLGNLPVLA